MVSHAVHEPDSAGIHWIAKGGLAQVPSALWLWCLVGTALDSLLWQHQSIECIYRSDLFLADWLLHGYLRAADLQRRISLTELLFSLITVLGVLCIFSLDARYRYGIAIGVVSSAVCALYAICNKMVSVGVRSRTVLMYQMSGGLVLVSAIIPVYLFFFPSNQPVIIIPEGSNLWFMLCHALFCTVGMYLLQIQALKRLSAFTVNLTYNLEPCYTIILAMNKT